MGASECVWGRRSDVRIAICGGGGTLLDAENSQSLVRQHPRYTLLLSDIQSASDGRDCGYIYGEFVYLRFLLTGEWVAVACV